MGKTVKGSLPKQDELSEEYKSDLQLKNITKSANAVISTAKIVGLIVLVAGIAIVSAMAPLDVAVAAAVVLTIGYMAFAGDNYGPQGCMTAIWGVVKYVLLLAILLLAFYVFMMMR